MNAVLLLVGLLVLSYLGSFLVAGRTVRGVGLPSGIEYVALGFVLGPQALDMVGPDMLAAFEPVVQVALGWLAFAVGLDFGYAGEHRARAGNLALGTFAALLTGGSVAAVTWLVVRRMHVGANVTEQILIAGGVGAACSETTRHAVRWVVDRHRAHGPLAERL
ncbi:MAG TPA: potassium transporter Kef, partial [Polyangiaceae bacterium]